MTVGLAAVLPGADKPTIIAVEEVPIGGSATGGSATREPATVDRASRDDVCAASGSLMYVGLNTWVHDPNVRCHHNAP
jgi:hypothetical protein